MTPKLSDDQRQAIDAEGGVPIYVVDDKRHTVYVLLPADTYQQIRPLFEPDTFAIRDSYPLQDTVAKRDGWNDPIMSAYDAFGSPPIA